MLLTGEIIGYVYWNNYVSVGTTYYYVEFNLGYVILYSLPLIIPLASWICLCVLYTEAF